MQTFTSPRRALCYILYMGMWRRGVTQGGASKCPAAAAAAKRAFLPMGRLPMGKDTPLPAHLPSPSPRLLTTHAPHTARPPQAYSPRQLFTTNIANIFFYEKTVDPFSVLQYEIN